MQKNGLLILALMFTAALTLIACMQQTQAGKYNADDPIQWLASQLESGKQQQEELSPDEILKLNEMARLAGALPVFTRARELCKRDMLIPVGLHKEYVPCYDEPSSSYVLRDQAKEKYPADGIDKEEGVTLISLEKANSFVQDLLGVGLPEKEADVPNIDGPSKWWVYSEKGVLYIPQSDFDPTRYVLEKYQKLDDNVFYLSFGNDLYGTPGPEEDWEIISGYTLMLVQRADTQWGFEIKAVLKQGFDNTLLPEGFPEPDQG